MKETCLRRAIRLAPFALLVILVALVLVHPVQVRAGTYWAGMRHGERFLDGGGLPTRTPTRTEIPLPPTEKASPTQDSIFPPTATMTLSLLEQQEVQAVPPNAVMATQPAPLFSWLSCWPIVLVMLVALIVGVLRLSGWLQRNTP